MGKVSEIPFKGDYIGGRWILSEKIDGEFVDTSPANLADTIMRLQYCYNYID